MACPRSCPKWNVLCGATGSSYPVQRPTAAKIPITREILLLIAEKRRLHKRWVRSRHPLDKADWNRAERSHRARHQRDFPRAEQNAVRWPGPLVSWMPEPADQYSLNLRENRSKNYERETPRDLRGATRVPKVQPLKINRQSEGGRKVTVRCAHRRGGD